MASSKVENKVVIEELNLIKFGKFDGFKIDLTSELNLIYGKNEAGKSTIQLFIKAMLYGMPARKVKGESLKERERAIPWDATYAEGVMKLRSGERSIEIHRRFGKTAAGDRFELFDGISGESISGYSENIGEELLGIPCGVFEKTMWIRQGGVLIDGTDEELTARLMNLQSGADENVSVDAALALLKRKRRQLKADDGRSAKGRIDILADRKEELRREKYELATRLTQTGKTQERLSAAQNEQKTLAEEISALEENFKRSREAERLVAVRERLKNIDECNQRLDDIYKSDDYIKGAELTEEDVNKAFEAEEHLERAKAAADNGLNDEKSNAMKKAGTASMMAGGGVVLAILMLLAAIIFFAKGSFGIGVVATAFLLIGIAFVVIGIRTAGKCKNIHIELDQDSKQAQAEVQTAKEVLEKALLSFDVSSASELMQLYNRCQGQIEVAKSLEKAKVGFLGQDSYDALKELACGGDFDNILPVAEIESLLDKNRKRQIELATEIKGLESKMAYDVKNESSLADIDTELSSIEDEIQSCRQKLAIIELAEEGIREAGAEWRRAFAPALTSRVNEIVDYLTSGRYNEVKISDDYRMRVSAEGRFAQAEYLSFGTYEQLYFALRLASAELLGGDAPLFLDDILTAYDDERATTALEFLQTAAKLRQVLIFTCHLSDRESAEKRDIHIINMN